MNLGYSNASGQHKAFTGAGGWVDGAGRLHALRSVGWVDGRGTCHDSPAPVAKTALSGLAVGALVRDDATALFGAPIVWQVADKNHTGYPANSVTLISHRVLAVMGFDAKEPSNTVANRKNAGNNRYMHSNLRRWLNSEAGPGAWYTAAHPADAPPNAAGFFSGLNPYDGWAGFLHGMSAKMRAALLPTAVSCARTALDGNGMDAMTDRVFLASDVEARNVCKYPDRPEGAPLALFSSDAARLANPTPQAVAKDQGSKSDAARPIRWWTRSINWTIAPGHSMMIVDDKAPNATYTGQTCFVADEIGVRPLLNLPGSIQAAQSPDAQGVRRLYFP